MKNKNLKTFLFIVIGGSISLSAVAISDETPQKKETSTTVTKTDTTTKTAKLEDPITKQIQDRILAPFIAQSGRYNTVSRVARRTEAVYKLVEVTEEASEGVRLFNITKTPIIRGKDSKPLTLIAVQLKHLAKSNKTLAKQGNDWVELEDHKYLRLIPNLSLNPISAPKDKASQSK